MANCVDCRQPINPDFLEVKDDKDYHKACLVEGDPDTVKCHECGKDFKIITGGHLAKHGVDMLSYRAKYGSVTSKNYNKVLKRVSRSKKGVKVVAQTWQSYEEWYQENAEESEMMGEDEVSDFHAKMHARYIRELHTKIREVVPESKLEEVFGPSGSTTETPNGIEGDLRAEMQGLHDTIADQSELLRNYVAESHVKAAELEAIEAKVTEMESQITEAGGAVSINPSLNNQLLVPHEIVNKLQTRTVTNLVKRLTGKTVADKNECIAILLALKPE